MTAARTISERLAEQAHEVWKMMLKYAERKNFARQRVGEYGDGRVIIATVGGFITALSKEREWGLAKNERDLIRRYLKATGNVVVLDKVEQYKYRIFVRGEWNDTEVIPFTVTSGDSEAVKRSKSEKRLTPEEAGEDREPEEVQTRWRCPEEGCDEEFDRKSLMASHRRMAHRPFISEAQAGVLCALQALGGRAEDEDGRALVDVLPEYDRRLEGYISSTVRHLRDRGLVDTDNRHPKRTYAVWLTDEGREFVKNIDEHRTTVAVIGDLLARVREVHANTGKLAEKLARQVNKNKGAIADALHTLEDDGLVHIYRSDGGYMTGVKWEGEPYEPYTKWPTVVQQDPPKRPQLPVKPPAKVSFDSDELSDEDLIEALSERLMGVDEKAELVAANSKVYELTEKLELIENLIREANDGELTPLKALSEIQEAVRL